MENHIRVTDDLDQLLAVLPENLSEPLKQPSQKEELIEIVMDLGRRPEARFVEELVFLREEPVTREDLDYVVSRLGIFTGDNRAGLERTLHRISAIRNRRGEIIGLTCRVGRAVFGTIDIIRDIVEEGKNLLLLGRPGVGKTTLLREVSRVLADEFDKRVVIVDTSNEIAGDGDIPHPGIGRARRMQVGSPEHQHSVMIEAVENHMPEVIIVDEIGTEREALAARTIAERGVQLVGTAHGNTLDNLLKNPTLADLVGGIQAVTLGDEQAKRRRTQKTVLERKGLPTFDVLIEIRNKESFAVHKELSEVVDSILLGHEPQPEMRSRDEKGKMIVKPGEKPQAKKNNWQKRNEEQDYQERAQITDEVIKVFPYAISKDRLEKAIRSSKAPVTIVKELDVADIFLTTKGQQRKAPAKIKQAKEKDIPMYVIKGNSFSNIERFINDLVGDRKTKKHSKLPEPMQETEEAIQQVHETNNSVELYPRGSSIRRLQHLLAERRGLQTRSIGSEPNRRVVLVGRKE